MQLKICTILRSLILFFELIAWLLVVAELLHGKFSRAVTYAWFALSTDIIGRIWSRKSPIPMPYFMKWVLLLPRGPQSPKHFQRVLQPRSGEHILEIGPGIGVHALSIAPSLLPNGVLDVLDLQEKMLDELERRAKNKGITNVVAKQGDARTLPFPERTFDAVYLIGVLGEIPDAMKALREIRRVLKPSGKLVISEFFVDPDFIPLSTLKKKVGEAGFEYKQSTGPRFAYTSVFRPAVDTL